MRALKRVFALAGMLALLQYLVIYYNSFQFDEFVQQEADRAPAKRELQEALLVKAREYALPVTETDISITTTGAVLRVAVDYTVPVNLLVYRPGLKFHAIGSGIVRQ